MRVARLMVDPTRSCCTGKMKLEEAIQIYMKIKLDREKANEEKKAAGA